MSAPARNSYAGEQAGSPGGGQEAGKTRLSAVLLLASTGGNWCACPRLHLPRRRASWPRSADAELPSGPPDRRQDGGLQRSCREDAETAAPAPDPQTVDDLGAERDAVAGQKDFDFAAREMDSCGIAPRIHLLTDMAQI